MVLPHIFLLGTGIRGTIQFTDETIQALRACRTAIVLHDDLTVHAAIRRHCRSVIDAAPLYAGVQRRPDAYRAMSRQVVAAATRNPPVAFIVHGHPLFLVSAAEYTLDLARKAGLRAVVLPAISSFDTLLVDLGIDYGYGVQMFDATTLLVRGWQPNPEVPLLIFQLATVLDDRVMYRRPGAKILRPLVDRLLTVYPPGHLCTMVHSATHVLEKSQCHAVALGKLPTARHLRLWRRPTLYVPALTRRCSPPTERRRS